MDLNVTEARNPDRGRTIPGLGVCLTTSPSTCTCTWPNPSQPGGGVGCKAWLGNKLKKQKMGVVGVCRVWKDRRRTAAEKE